MKIYYYISDTDDAYKNLARDEYLLTALESNAVILYFYINCNAVIIGRNQNPWSECNLEALERDGVQLVRRITGGGAVYHDLGNLNFSFITSEEHYDELAQNKIIISALEKIGVHAEKNGRNDITICGKKFSGNAFGVKDGNRQRHGTLLVSSKLDKMGDYLNVPTQKLKAKGISSVRSRVCNLSEFVPELTVMSLAQLIKNAYGDYYNVLPEEYIFSPEANEKIDELYKKHSSFEWIMGEAPHFDYSFEERFSFGMAQFCVSVRNGRIERAELYTDSLNTDLSAEVRGVLEGIEFSRANIVAKIRSIKSTSAYTNELAAYIESNL